MAKKRLNNDQQLMLFDWQAEGISGREIAQRANEAEKSPGATAPASARRECRRQDEQSESESDDDALTTGLARRAARVARLKEHAEQLAAMKWDTDPKTGRLLHEKAWRETLNDIAREMGERRPKEDGGAEHIIKVYVGIDLNRV
ncbi:MAG TPA: hypothetical protein VNO70_17690 [Blastocatellia bacterium]|nr:hypothetical protein [Blastocatellia bacterium]